MASYRELSLNLAEGVALLEKENAELRKDLAEKGADIRDYVNRLEKWEPEKCNRPGCAKAVPTRHMLDALEAVDVPARQVLGLGALQYMSLGYCSEGCHAESEPKRPALSVVQGGAQP